MKTTMKLLSFTLAILLLIPALVGCHGSKGVAEFVIPEEFDTSRQYEITFWAKNENNEAQRAVYANAVTEFEKLYPNIKVTLKHYADYKDIYNNVITNIATNTTPNVCITYPDHIATYKEGQNTVVPLDQLIINEKYGFGGSELRYDAPSSDEIVQKFLDEGKIGGVQYALPYMRSTEACYINKDLLESLGFEVPEVLTWDFVWEVSEYAISLGKDENDNYIANGQKTLIPFIYKSTDNMMISMLKQLEAPYSNDNGEILLFNDTTKQLLLEISKHGQTKAFSTFKISSYPGNFLNAGQCIFAIDSTAGSTWMGANSPLSDIHTDQRIDFETVVLPIPQFNTESPRMISQGPSICIFNKEDSGEVLASWLFAQFLLTNEVQIAYSQTEGYIPVTTKAQNSAEYIDYLERIGEDNNLYYDVKIKTATLLIDNTENTFVTPVFNGSTSLRDASGQLIEEVTKAVRRNRTVDDKYIDTLYEDMTALYRLDRSGNSSAPNSSGSEGLPPTAVALLATLGITWVLIITYVVVDTLKNRIKNKK